MSEVLEVGFRIVLILAVTIGGCYLMYLHDRLTEPERRRETRRTERAWADEALRTGRIDPARHAVFLRSGVENRPDPGLREPLED